MDELLDSLEYNLKEVLSSVSPGPSKVYIHLTAALVILSGIQGKTADMDDAWNTVRESLDQGYYSDDLDAGKSIAKLLDTFYAQ